MEKPDFTPRNVSKMLLRSAVDMKVTQLTRNAVANYTRYESDNMLVTLGAHVVGWAVASQLEPVTDKIIDVTADFVSEQYTKRRTKKNKTEEK